MASLASRSTRPGRRDRARRIAAPLPPATAPLTRPAQTRPTIRCRTLRGFRTSREASRRGKLGGSARDPMQNPERVPHLPRSFAPRQARRLRTRIPGGRGTEPEPVASRTLPTTASGRLSAAGSAGRQAERIRGASGRPPRPRAQLVCDRAGDLVVCRAEISSRAVDSISQGAVHTPGRPGSAGAPNRDTES